MDNFWKYVNIAIMIALAAALFSGTGVKHRYANTTQHTMEQYNV